MWDKSAIHHACVEQCQTRIASLQADMRSLRESAASDTKSSMGDKYETAREMAQMELNKLALQLQEAQHALALFNAVQPDRVCHEAGHGALVITDRMAFYLVAALGKIRVPAGDVMAISVVSPAGKAMLGKRKGESFSVNGNPFRISVVY